LDERSEVNRKIPVKRPERMWECNVVWAERKSSGGERAVKTGVR